MKKQCPSQLGTVAIYRQRKREGIAGRGQAFGFLPTQVSCVCGHQHGCPNLGFPRCSACNAGLAVDVTGGMCRPPSGRSRSQPVSVYGVIQTTGVVCITSNAHGAIQVVRGYQGDGVVL